MEIALMTTILDFEGDVATLDGPPGLEGGVLDEPPAPVSSNAGPLDAALLQAAHQAGLDVAALRANRPVEACYQLDPLRRRMSVIYRRGVRLWVSVKGAPEAVLEACTRRWTADGVDHLTEVDRQAIVETAAVLAEGGGRVIALAERAVPPEEARRPFTPASVERDLNFAGLLALTDRIRPESSLAVQQCQRAGIQVLLVTGDHPVAARAAGLQSGLTVADKPVLTGPELAGKPPAELLAAVQRQRVLAQTNPLQKLQVVQALQSGGACVAATGSYPMEAPVLAAADVGVARQEGASDAARLAADLVLLDGRFSALVRAIARGRLIYANLSKTLSLYLAAKLGLLMAITLPVLLGVPLPLSVPQLVLAGLGLATALPLVYPREAAEHALMRRPPPDRRRAPFTPLMIARLLRGAFGLFVVVTISYFGSLLGFGDLPRARMLAFCTWMIMLVLLAYSLRSDTGGLLSQNPLSNRALFIWATLVVVLVVGFAAWPAAAALLGGGALTPFEWVLCLLALLIGLVFVEVRKWVAGRGLGR
jgi:Ca2+-transporting ATPase